MKNGEKFKSILNNQFGICFACRVRAVMYNSIGTYGCLNPKNEDDQEKVCAMCLHESLEWLNAEYKYPILTDEEKGIIKSIVNMLSHFECVPFNVELDKNVYGDYIRFWYKNAHGSVNALNTPNFDHTKMFKGMKLDRNYTLEELGL